MTISRLLFAAVLLLPGAMAHADPADTATRPRQASHRHARHHAHAQASAGLIQPQAKPAAATPPEAGPAPVPNEAVAAPINDPAPQPSAGPSVFQLHYPPQGDGYVTGSSPQALDDRDAAKATGVEVKVPLPQ